MWNMQNTLYSDLFHIEVKLISQACYLQQKCEVKRKKELP